MSRSKIPVATCGQRLARRGATIARLNAGSRFALVGAGFTRKACPPPLARLFAANDGQEDKQAGPIAGPGLRSRLDPALLRQVVSRP